jgi:hypothetical protein
MIIGAGVASLLELYLSLLVVTLGMKIGSAKDV